MGALALVPLQFISTKTSRQFAAIASRFKVFHTRLRLLTTSADSSLRLTGRQLGHWLTKSLVPFSRRRRREWIARSKHQMGSSLIVWCAWNGSKDSGSILAA